MLVHLLLIWCAADEQNALRGLRHGEGREPCESGEKAARDINLAGANQQRETAGGGDEAGGCGQGSFELLDGAHGDQIGGGGEVLGAIGKDVDIREAERAHEFAQEGSFLVLRFDEGEAQAREVDLHGKPGEAGAGADVDQASGGKEVAGGEEGLAKMSCHDIIGIAHAGEVDARVPLQQQVEVGLELRQLCGGEGRVEERREQGKEVHGEQFRVSGFEFQEEVGSCRLSVVRGRTRGVVGLEEFGKIRPVRD